MHCLGAAAISSCTYLCLKTEKTVSSNCSHSWRRELLSKDAIEWWLSFQHSKPKRRSSYSLEVLVQRQGDLRRHVDEALAQQQPHGLAGVAQDLLQLLRHAGRRALLAAIQEELLHLLHALHILATSQAPVQWRDTGVSRLNGRVHTWKYVQQLREKQRLDSICDRCLRCCTHTLQTTGPGQSSCGVGGKRLQRHCFVCKTME